MLCWRRGCCKDGDIIEFVRRFDQVDFKTAVQKLATYLPSADPIPGQTKETNKKKSPEPKPLTAAHIKLLARVIHLYHTAFCEAPRGTAYLATRGITDKQLFADHKIGLTNGTLLNVLFNEGEVMKRFQELGILNVKGHEHSYNCAPSPLYNLAGNPACIYGPRIQGEGAAHLYLSRRSTRALQPPGREEQPGRPSCRIGAGLAHPDQRRDQAYHPLLRHANSWEPPSADPLARWCGKGGRKTRHYPIGRS